MTCHLPPDTCHQVIPATSLTLPLLGRYLLFSMVLVAVSVCLATIVLNLHYRSTTAKSTITSPTITTPTITSPTIPSNSRKPSTHKMPTWVRAVLIQKMPGILLMRVPKQVSWSGCQVTRWSSDQVVR